MVDGYIMSVLEVVFMDEPDSSSVVQVVVDGIMSDDVIVVVAVVRKARLVFLRSSTASLRMLSLVACVEEHCVVDFIIG